MGTFKELFVQFAGSVGGFGGPFVEQDSDVLSAAAGCFSPLPRPFKACRVEGISERAEPCKPGLPTAPQDGDLYEGLGVVLQAFAQP